MAWLEEAKTTRARLSYAPYAGEGLAGLDSDGKRKGGCKRQNGAGHIGADHRVPG